MSDQNFGDEEILEELAATAKLLSSIAPGPTDVQVSYELKVNTRSERPSRIRQVLLVFRGETYRGHSLHSANAAAAIALVAMCQKVEGLASIAIPELMENR